MAVAKKKATRKRAAQKTSVQVDRQTSPSQKTSTPTDTEVGETGQAAPKYEPVRQPLENASFDHKAAEEKRQAELTAQRDEHNRRTAGSAT